jgi:hypothetical protein
MSLLEAPLHAIPEIHIRHENDPQTRKKKIYCKQELIVSNLQKFYAARDDIKEILEIFEGVSHISLRLIDWFVTNYSKHKSISYIVNGQEFMVYTNYKSQLKAYSKKLFDPFCRRERIMFQIPNHESFLTTVGKLNFFRWAIEKKVLEYIKMNFKTIESEMNKASREIQKQRTASTTQSSSTASSNGTVSTTDTKRNNSRKRYATTEPVQTKWMQKHEHSIEVTFD